MFAVASLGVVLVLSLVVDASIARWSVKKVMGVKISFFKSLAMIVTRNSAALLCGFSIGYAIKIALEEQAMEGTIVKLIGVSCISLCSFLVYWALMGKVTKNKVSLWSMIKAVAMEYSLLALGAIIISIIISTLYFTFSNAV